MRVPRRKLPKWEERLIGSEAVDNLHPTSSEITGTWDSATILEQLDMDEDAEAAGREDLSGAYPERS
jgi:hypothetical protein